MKLGRARSEQVGAGGGRLRLDQGLSIFPAPPHTTIPGGRSDADSASALMEDFLAFKKFQEHHSQGKTPQRAPRSADTMFQQDPVMHHSSAMGPRPSAMPHREEAYNPRLAHHMGLHPQVPRAQPQSHSRLGFHDYAAHTPSARSGESFGYCTPADFAPRLAPRMMPAHDMSGPYFYGGRPSPVPYPYPHPHMY